MKILCRSCGKIIEFIIGKDICCPNCKSKTIIEYTNNDCVYVSKKILKNIIFIHVAEIIFIIILLYINVLMGLYINDNDNKFLSIFTIKNFILSLIGSIVLYFIITKIRIKYKEGNVDV